MDKVHVGILIGSIRKGSFTRQVANNVIKMLPEWMEAQILDISGLPLYNQDFDDGGVAPEAYHAFRALAQKQDAFLFLTPEHNRSVPAALKNAIDVGSRPIAESVWSGKPGAVISVSPGAIAGFGANHHLRQSMTFLNVYMMQQPECYLGGITKCLDDEGNIIRDATNEFLSKVVEAYAFWVRRFVGEQ